MFSLHCIACNCVTCSLHSFHVLSYLAMHFHFKELGYTTLQRKTNTTFHHIALHTCSFILCSLHCIRFPFLSRQFMSFHELSFRFVSFHFIFCDSRSMFCFSYFCSFIFIFMFILEFFCSFPCPLFALLLLLLFCSLVLLFHLPFLFSLHGVVLHHNPTDNVTTHRG